MYDESEQEKENKRTNEFQENSEGQLEIGGIDTPIGAAANSYLESVRDLNTAKGAVETAKDVVFEEMENLDKKTFLFEGKTFTRVKGSIKNDTLRISN